MRTLHRASLCLKRVGNKWNNSITVARYKVYKTNVPFFLSNSGVLFFIPPHPSPNTFVALVAINKLQENYFCTTSQCFSYLPAAAVTSQMLLFKMSVAGNMIAYVLQWLKSIIILCRGINSFLLFCFSIFLMSGYLSNIPNRSLVSPILFLCLLLILTQEKN